MGKLRLFTAFSGYDSQCLALDRLKRDYPNFDYELVGWSEIDKYAIQAHDALYPQWADRNYGDISQIDWSQVPDFDFLTYSFPCTDISNAGQQQGFYEGSGTRSSLLWECRKAIVQKRPKYLLMENVKAICSKKFMPLFAKWLKSLEDYGYYTNWQVLNAKNYGIPQNRERCFAISIRRDLLDPNPIYHFPKPFELKLRLKDMLEVKVDEKYYLSDNMISNILSDSGTFVHKEPCTPPYSGVASALNARMAKMGRHENSIKEVGKYSNSQNGRVILDDGVSPACINGEKDGMPKVLVTKGVVTPNYRIRRLTPRECFRLMGVEDADIDKLLSAGISNTQLYKCAGNSIVVDNLYHIMRKIFIDTTCESVQPTLFSQSMTQNNNQQRNTMSKEMNAVKQAIKSYLDNRAKTDELFAVAYAKPHKNIDECFNYILGEARKQGNAVYLPDDVVFGWAVHYYDEDDIKINKLPANTKVSARASVELTEEDKEKAREQAIETFKKQCIDKLQAEEEAKAKREAEKAAEKRRAEIERRKQLEQSQGNLFQF
ncbi:MAG: DNA (cytosine-5-)-methyltransferase [Muribaculaceae bacterium]|nr:DNA (cytosine-5-)-methyltransferase [Muribaculaceae bacterium]